jgi:hypothetical protein
MFSMRNTVVRGVSLPTYRAGGGTLKQALWDWYWGFAAPCRFCEYMCVCMCL